jgi:hypothetical protein
MTTLDSEVRSVVQAFMQSGELFTALDVSNKVKMALPLVRHREVRDLVRGMFTTDIEPAQWARSTITVTLADGSQAEAMLYHPLSDTWDLDNKYDIQKRQQASVKPAQVAAQALGLATPVTVPAPVVAAPVPTPAAKDLWAGMFQSQPSLFPRK